MSRPGFIFDLPVHEAGMPTQFTCRGCGVAEPAEGTSDASLHQRMREHVRARHAPGNADDWHITHHERGEGARVFCFWPPEAI